jgi:hypothetical protein
MTALMQPIEGLFALCMVRQYRAVFSECSEYALDIRSANPVLKVRKFTLRRADSDDRSRVGNLSLYETESSARNLR